MAKCPSCNKELKPWHIKAECPYCGANIPNHNWEQNLETDAQQREAAFYKMHVFLTRLKYSVIGTPLRLIRLIMSFLPIIGYVVPLASLKLSGADGTAIDVGAVNAIAFFTKDDFKIMSIFKMLTDGINQEADKFALISLILLVASLLFGVIAFFLIPITNKWLNTPVIGVLHFISTALYCTSPFMFNKFISAYNGLSLGECTGAPSFGIYIGAALFLAVTAVDIILASKKVDKLDYKYVPTDDKLQRAYAIKIGAITENEMPKKKIKNAE